MPRPSIPRPTLRARLLPPLCLALLLAACAADPAHRCAPADTRELATIDRLIATTRAEIERGYRNLPDDPNLGVNLCLGGYQSHVGLSLCTDPRSGTRTEPLDPAASARTLEALLARREALQARISAAVAACPGT